MKLKNVIETPGVQLTVVAVVHKKGKIMDNRYFPIVIVDSDSSISGNIPIRSGSISGNVPITSGRPLLGYDELQVGRVYSFTMRSVDSKTGGLTGIFYKISSAEEVELLIWYETHYKVIRMPETFPKVRLVKNEIKPRISIKGVVNMVGEEIICSNGAILNTYIIGDETDNITLSVFGDNFVLNKGERIFVRNVKVDQENGGRKRFTFDDLSDIIGSQIGIFSQSEQSSQEMSGMTDTSSQSTVRSQELFPSSPLSSTPKKSKMDDKQFNSQDSYYNDLLEDIRTIETGRKRKAVSRIFNEIETKLSKEDVLNIMEGHRQDETNSAHIVNSLLQMIMKNVKVGKDILKEAILHVNMDNCFKSSSAADLVKIMKECTFTDESLVSLVMSVVDGISDKQEKRALRRKISSIIEAYLRPMAKSEETSVVSEKMNVDGDGENSDKSKDNSV